MIGTLDIKIRQVEARESKRWISITFPLEGFFQTICLSQNMIMGHGKISKSGLMSF